MKPSQRWSRIVELVAQEYPHAVVESEGALRFVLVTREPDPVRVGIRVRRIMLFGHEVVAIAADLGHAAHTDASSALALNALLVHGTLIVEDGVLYSRALVALDDDTIARFDPRVRLLALEAAALKRRNRTPRAAVSSVSSAVAHFSD
ncbi:MAG: hypothetical protein ACKV2T_25455 [Kofleriaceae bacterium]